MSSVIAIAVNITERTRENPQQIDRRYVSSRGVLHEALAVGCGVR